MSQTMLLIGGALYGAFAMQVYGLSAVHANDYAEPHEFVAVSGGLLLIYGAAIHLLLGLFGLYRLTQRKAAEDNRDFVGMVRPRSGMLILRSHPRNLLKRRKPPKDPLR